MTNYFQDLSNILPLLLIGGGILFSLVIEMFINKSEKLISLFSLLLFIFVAVYSIVNINNITVSFNSMIASGNAVNIFYFLFNFAAAIVTLISIDYIKKININYGEFYIILQSAVLGMMLLASARDLILVFVGLEQMSICFYVLAGFRRNIFSSIEASLKYFLLGAFATGFLVYGMALIYGSVHTLSIASIYLLFSTSNVNLIFITGVLFFIIGFSFKIAAVPFHQWVPDVYQGAPTNVAALMSTAGKAAAFSALIFVLFPILNGTNKNIFTNLLSIFSVLSMLYGSIVAIAQTDLKRMLAYSSIAHAGYMIIGIASGITLGIAGIIFYLLVYTFMNLGAFAVISIVEGKSEENLNLNSYAGLSSKFPFLAGMLALFLFALAGIPPLGGFFGKYYVFLAAIKSNLIWLAIVGVLSSAINVYFYLRVVVFMYFKNSSTELDIINSKYTLIGIILCALVVVVMGFFPDSFINLISASLHF